MEEPKTDTVSVGAAPELATSEMPSSHGASDEGLAADASEGGAGSLNPDQPAPDDVELLQQQADAAAAAMADEAAAMAGVASDHASMAAAAAVAGDTTSVAAPMDYAVQPTMSHMGNGEQSPREQHAECLVGK